MVPFRAHFVRVFVATFVLGWFAAGCGTQPTGDQTSGGTTGVAAPSFQFTSPAGGVKVTDDKTLSIAYSVNSDRPMSVSVTLDQDQTPDNGNEVALSHNRPIAAGANTDSFDIIVGQYQYGTYNLRANVTDGSNNYSFDLLGQVSIIPLYDNGGSTAQSDGFQVLNDVAGKRLLHTTGSPGPINSRVPFLATWSAPDYADHLSPIFIMPFEVKQTMEVSRAQFYTFGHITEEPKEVEFYQGTDDTSLGTLIQHVDATVKSFETGGWNLITIDPPVTLQPGKYGISFRAKFEFSDNWSGNAAAGPGFTWVSTFVNEPFNKATSADIGVGANFTFRLIGHNVPETGGPSANSKLVIPDALDPIYPDNGSKPPEGLGDKTPDADPEGGSTPYHVRWQNAR